jgi:hypothetical protein
VREVGGRQAAVMNLARGSLEALMGTALSAGPEARKGVAQVAAANVSNEAMRGQCVEWLLAFFDDEDQDVRRAAAEWVNSSAESGLLDTELILEFLGSAAFGDDPSDLLTRLDESTRFGAATLLMAVEEVVAHISDLSDMQTTLGADLNLLAKLAIRAYASAPDHQTQSKALDLIDQLMALRGSPMRHVVARYE